MVQCPACKSWSSTDTCSVCETRSQAGQNTGTLVAVNCEHSVDAIRTDIERIIEESTHSNEMTNLEFNRLTANLTLYAVNTMWTHCDEVVSHYRSMLAKERKR